MADIYVGSSSLDITAPAVTNQQPSPGAIGVLPSTNVSFRVDDDIGGSGVDSSTITVSIDGTPAVALGVFQAGFTGTITPASNGFDVVINPDIDLPISLVTIVVDASDLAVPSNSMTQVLWSFTPGDAAPPTISIVSPSDASVEQPQSSLIVFDVVDDSASPAVSGVDMATLNVAVGSNQAIIGGSAQNGWTMNASIIADGYRVTVARLDVFEIFETIVVIVDVDDNAGNSATTKTWSFRIIEGLIESPVLTAVAVDGSINLSWTVNPLVAIDTWRLVRSIDSFPLSITDGDTIFEDQSATVFTDDDVKNGTSYYYTIFLVRRMFLGEPVYVPYDAVASGRGTPSEIAHVSFSENEYTPERGELGFIVNPIPGARIKSDDVKSLSFTVPVGGIVRAPWGGSLTLQKVDTGIRVSIRKGDTVINISPVRPTVGEGAVVEGNIIGRIESGGAVMTVDKLPGRFIRPISIIFTAEKRDG